MPVTAFKDIGKSVRDLLKKKFEFKHNASIHSDLTRELRIESGVSASDKGGIEGDMKVTYKRPDVELEGTYFTQNKLEGKIKTTKLAKNITTTISGNQKPSANLNVEYAKDCLHVSGAIDYSGDSTFLEGSTSVSYENATVGLKGRYDITKRTAADYNAAAEYKNGDHILTLATEDRAEKIVGSYFLTRNAGNTFIGSQFTLNLSNPADQRTLALVAQHTVESMLVKAKADTDGVLSGVVEHKLKDLPVKATMAGQWNTKFNKKEILSPDKFGLGLTFGDFKF